MREVAAAADVAISSVSRVLSGHPDVSPEMRDRVMDAVARLDYERDFLAQSLRRGQTLSIGFVLGDIANPVMADLMLGTEADLRQAGYTILLALNPDGRPGVDAERIRLLLSRRVDGLIVSSASEDDPTTLEALRQARVPLVVVDRTLPAGLSAGAALTDHATGIAAAVDHLTALGHRRFAFISGPEDTFPVRARLHALRASLDGRAGVAFTTVHGPLSVEHGRRAALDLLSRSDRPTALITGGLRHLAGALEAIRELDMRLPTDVSLVTCDDTQLARLHAPAIACVARDAVMLGTEAAGLVRDMLAGGPPRTSYRPTTFIARESCAPAP